MAISTLMSCSQRVVDHFDLSPAVVKLPVGFFRVVLDCLIVVDHLLRYHVGVRGGCVAARSRSLSGYGAMHFSLWV
eukprot:8613407-Heterocapsa_arctica.AAC.1